MLDSELTDQASVLIAKVIAELIDDANLVAAARSFRPVVSGQAQELLELGWDVSVLAAAIGVLARRTPEGP